MYSEHDRTIFPLLDQTNFFINNVGISFAFKTRLFYEGNKFIPSSAEDYYFLDKLRQGAA